MKNIQNRHVLVLVMLIIAMTTFGCRGAKSGSIRENLLANREAPLSRQSAAGSASVDSSPAKVDINSAKNGLSGVALASYESQGKKAKQAQWLTSYEEAVELSEQSGRPILADFTGSNWCGYCVKLKKEVFDTPQFRAWAADNVVLLELDFPSPRKPNDWKSDWIKQQNLTLKERYHITGFPTVMILNPDGSVIGMQGYEKGGPEQWIGIVNNSIQSNRALQNAKLVDASSLDNRQ